MKKSILPTVGFWSFLVGLILAILAAFVPLDAAMLVAVLAILGVIVGFVNVTAKETTEFLVATIALMLAAASLQVIPFGAEKIVAILGNIQAFIAPAAVIVALKALYEVASAQ
ncbi:hypothetical protein HY991_03130 [Candidatus Micrarchaeota archaeon]|nr:hypothetical protein [Candidatus Micrarchaeota archaeon]